MGDLSEDKQQRQDGHTSLLIARHACHGASTRDATRWRIREHAGTQSMSLSATALGCLRFCARVHEAMKGDEAARRHYKWGEKRE